MAFADRKAISKALRLRQTRSNATTDRCTMTVTRRVAEIDEDIGGEQPHASPGPRWRESKL